MARDASGTYTRVSNSFSVPVSGTTISTTDAVALFDEIEDEITDSLSRSGKGGMSADLDMNNNDINEIKTAVFQGSTSGNTTVAATAIAGTTTLTLPAATDTLVGKATTDTLTNKTFDTAGTGNSFSINGVAATANTGTGAVVRETSPTLVTPALGTPASGVLTNATGLPVATGISGLGTGVATALAVNVGSAGAPVTFDGALGTPSSGVATNLTGTASGLTAGTFTAGSASNLSSGTLPAARTDGHMNGTATNDDAAAGEVGEYISSTVVSASAVTLTTNTPADITSISLTAGDWDVWATIDTNMGGTTDVTQILAWINTTSATIPTAPNGGAYLLLNYTATHHIGFNDHFPVGKMRISVAGTTTVYFSTRVIFTVSTAKAYGVIAARRVR